MHKELMTTLDLPSRVKKWILEPLVGRGLPAKGWSEAAWFSDALEQLNYPEHILEAAARKVRANHTRTTWPLPSEFRQACEEILADEPTATSYAEAAPRSAEAWEYVRRRLLASELGLRQYQERGAGEIRRYLFDRACADLREGREPYVSDADVERHIADHEAWCLEHYGPKAAAKSSLIGDLGATARELVERARPKAAYIDPAVIAAAEPTEPELEP